MDLFLKFESAEQAKPFLYEVTTEYHDKDGTPVFPSMEGEYPAGAIAKEVLKPKFLNIDIIGDINKPTGETQEVPGPGETMITIPVMEKLEGYHVNVRLVGEDASELEQFSITPANPVRVWA